MESVAPGTSSTTRETHATFSVVIELGCTDNTGCESPVIAVSDIRVACDCLAGNGLAGRAETIPRSIPLK